MVRLYKAEEGISNITRKEYSQCEISDKKMRKRKHKETLV